MLRTIHDPERGAGIVEYAALIVLVASMVAMLANAGIAQAIGSGVRSGVDQVFDEPDFPADGGTASDAPAAAAPLPQASVGPDGEVTYSGGSGPAGDDPGFRIVPASDGPLLNDALPDIRDDEEEEGAWDVFLDRLGRGGGAFGTSVLNDLEGIVDAFTTNPLDSFKGLIDTIANDPVGLLFSDELRDAWNNKDWSAIIGHGLWEVGTWAIPGAGLAVRILKMLGKGPGAPRAPDGPGSEGQAPGSGEGGSGRSDSDSDGGRRDENGVSCPGGSNSFVPATLVLMADGSTKPIELVEVGHEVLATDPLTGQSGPRAVTHLIEGAGAKTLVDITVTDVDGHVATITATDAHPFWVPDLAQWIDAVDLEPGSWLRTSTGTWVQASAVEVRTVVDQQVYNLTVAGLHTYYIAVGGVDILVHNDGCGEWAADFESLPQGRQSSVRMVNTGEELRIKFDQWTEGAERIESPSSKVPDVYMLPDGTRIQWRTASRSGGETIDIFLPDRTRLKVHVENE
ncbi:polymorphic toxin-type HINT domain-containing protein [Nocardiopsis ansamitocini]|uniref:Pretoxin HINT domain-containing protein n=1 Tax=Nocardiopsis ansamitocini TaxID=1670832 RepID=A0A9W6ULA8_9ACTN|nr:polymorphic toxin-type HINT domain-containing protein [Nocardiopsis ansamitocini]GLU50522.1 hypothetical protein Nans01_48730 [Nocardiopsis ansamitocini]